MFYLDTGGKILILAKRCLFFSPISIASPFLYWATWVRVMFLTGLSADPPALSATLRCLTSTPQFKNLPLKAFICEKPGSPFFRKAPFCDPPRSRNFFFSE
jgi:hypothetical protein